MDSKCIFLFFLIVLITTGCKNSDIQKEIEVLKIENDSLKNLLGVLETKFVFDSIAVKEVPNCSNTYKNGSRVKGEIIIAAYNTVKKNYNIILGDSISFKNEISVHNPDTLNSNKGSFFYERKLSDTLSLEGLIDLNQRYGSKYLGHYNAMIIANDNE